jgi:hypothetical protein
MIVVSMSIEEAKKICLNSNEEIKLVAKNDFTLNGNFSFKEIEAIYILVRAIQFS